MKMRRDEIENMYLVPTKRILNMKVKSMEEKGMWMRPWF